MSDKQLTDAELAELILARNRRDNGKTFTVGGGGRAIVDQMEWESLHSRVLLAEEQLRAVTAELAEARCLLDIAMCDVIPRSGLAADIETFLARTKPCP